MRYVYKGPHETLYLGDIAMHRGAPVELTGALAERAGCHPDVASIEDNDKKAQEPANADVRAWAREQGLKIPARGKLPADVVERYRAAHTRG